MTTVSVTAAVHEAAVQARANLIALAVQDAVAGAWRAGDQVDFCAGKIALKAPPDQSEKFESLLMRHGKQPVEGMAHLNLDLDNEKFSCHSFGAVFAEVGEDPLTAVTGGGALQLCLTLAGS
jgi:xanthine dehydrogenase YagR molybdenum-binding subunit